MSFGQDLRRPQHRLPESEKLPDGQPVVPMCSDVLRSRQSMQRRSTHGQVSCDKLLQADCRLADGGAGMVRGERPAGLHGNRQANHCSRAAAQDLGTGLSQVICHARAVIYIYSGTLARVLTIFCISFILFYFFRAYLLISIYLLYIICFSFLISLSFNIAWLYHGITSRDLSDQILFSFLLKYWHIGSASASHGAAQALALL